MIPLDLQTEVEFELTFVSRYDPNEGTRHAAASALADFKKGNYKAAGEFFTAEANKLDYAENEATVTRNLMWSKALCPPPPARNAFKAESPTKSVGWLNSVGPTPISLQVRRSSKRNYTYFDEEEPNVDDVSDD